MINILTRSNFFGFFFTETDLCATNNGGCSEHATCTKISPGERSCTCKKDYTGDGTVCLGMRFENITSIGEYEKDPELSTALIPLIVG